MCTVSWHYSEDGYDLFFNRDELRTRGRALPPAVHRAGNVRYIAPTDSDRGGTWIGVNEEGTTHCLLNAYEAAGSTGRPVVARGTASFRSRGEIVRSVQASNTPHRTESALHEFGLDAFPPFHLLQVTPTAATLFSWTGTELAVTGSVQTPVTTSSFRSADVREWRCSQFGRVVGGAAGRGRAAVRGRVRARAAGRSLGTGSHAPCDAVVQAMWRYHRTKHPRRPAYGPCMSRTDARTVSFTYVAVRTRPSRAVGIAYFDGPPCLIRTLPTPDLLKGGALVPQKALDIEKMFAERAPGLFQRLPPGTLSLLRVVARETPVNARLKRMQHLDADTFCRRALGELGVSVRLEGTEHLAPLHRPVFACTHPSGGIEGMALVSAITSRFGDVAFPANELLGRVVPLARHIVPIDRYRGNATVARAYDELFRGDAPILIFPAGRTARVRGGILREYPWQKSFVAYSRRHRRPVCPVWVGGGNSKLFYLIFRARRALKIGWNIEMFLLVRELFKRRGETLVLRFNAPWTAAGIEQLRSSGLTDAEIALRIQRRVAACEAGHKEAE